MAPWPFTVNQIRTLPWEDRAGSTWTGRRYHIPKPSNENQISKVIFFFFLNQRLTQHIELPYLYFMTPQTDSVSVRTLIKALRKIRKSEVDGGGQVTCWQIFESISHKLIIHLI